MQAIPELKRIHLHTFVNIKKARATDFSSDGLIRRCLEKIIRDDTGKKPVLNVLKRHLTLVKKPVDSQLVAVAVSDTTGKVVASSDESVVGKNISDNAFKDIIDKADTDARIAVFPPNPPETITLQSRVLWLYLANRGQVNGKFILSINAEKSIQCRLVVSGNGAGAGANRLTGKNRFWQTWPTSMAITLWAARP